MDKAFGYFLAALLVTFLGVVVVMHSEISGVQIPGIPKVEIAKEEIVRKLPTLRDEIVYDRDPRTGICFSSANPKFNFATVSPVECTPEVLKAIEQDRNYLN